MSEITDIVTNLKGWLKDWDGIEADCVGMLRQMRIEQIEVLKRAVREIESLRQQAENYRRDIAEPAPDIVEAVLSKHRMHYAEGKITGRVEGLEEAAKIATDYEGDQWIEPYSTRLLLCRKIADAIRKKVAESV